MIAHRANTIALALSLLACAPALGQAAKTAAGAKKTAKPRPNVLLITVDTLRADHLGCYGYSKIKTPAIDALARDGVLYERAISQVPLTWPSHAAMLTGTYPFHNGVQDFTGQPLSPKFRLVSQAFQQNGYATGAVVSSFVLDRSWGLARGFDQYDDRFKGADFMSKNLALVERRADESVERAMAWLRKPRTQPFFLWLHLYDPHSPYDPPEPFRSQAADPYDGEIAYVDAQLARLFQWLKARGLYQRTAIVLVSDHGESLGEHGEKEHGFFVYDSTIHVPLIVKPAGRTRGARVEAVAETISIAPELLKLAGITDAALAKQFDAQDLPRTDSAEERAAYAETMYPLSSFGWSPLRALRTSEYHYVQAPKAELYEMAGDPKQQKNVIANKPAVADVMRQNLQARTASAAQQAASGGMDPATAEKLRALGYMAYRAPVPAESLDKLADPKDKIAAYQAIIEASDAFQRGEWERGESLLATVRKSDPQLYLVPFMLGEAALKRRDFQTAASELQNALKLNPHFDEAMTAVAQALRELDKTDEAKQWLRQALQENPQNFRAWYQMGWVDMRERPQEAVQSFQKALAIQPNFALAHRDLGMTEFTRQRYAQAAQHLSRAAELGIDDAPLFNFLGISYSRTGKYQQAVQSYRRALKQQPEYAEAQLNLAFAYQNLGREKQAEAAYAEACRLNPQFCRARP